MSEEDRKALRAAKARQIEGKMQERTRLRSKVQDLAGYNNRQIAAILGWPINTVTPRVHELREQGKVVLSEKRPDNLTGRTVMHWRIP